MQQGVVPGNWQNFLYFATQKGTVKKTALSDFANVRKGGIIAIGIEPGDMLIEVKLTTGHDEVVIITKEGMSIRFSEEDVRSMGRPAGGVRGISLDQNDAVVALAVVVTDSTLLVAGENGIGKRTDFGEYRLQSRGQGAVGQGHRSVGRRTEVTLSACRSPQGERAGKDSPG